MKEKFQLVTQMTVLCNYNKDNKDCKTGSCAGLDFTASLPLQIYGCPEGPASFEVRRSGEPVDF